MSPAIQHLVPLLVGACLGSFLNVCIYRIPLGRSVIYPGSHCAACGAPIPWQHNIPVVSWFLLKGRAACCGTKIDGRYPVVEALTAGLMWAVWQIYGHEPVIAFIHTLAVSGLLLATFIDIDHFIIPDRVSLGGCVLGLGFAVIFPEFIGAENWLQGLWRSFLGLAVGGGLLFIIAVLGLVVFRKEAMGMGDVKLVAAMGAFYGWEVVPFVVAVASFIGSAFGLATLLYRRRHRWGVAMPFGPHLAAAALIYILGGNVWMANYLARIVSP